MIEEEIRENIQGHIARNAEIASQLRQRGTALDQMQSIDHHFWAKVHEDAILLAQQLYERGYLIQVISPTNMEDGSTWWNVEASLSRTLSDVTGQETTEALVRLAARFESIYDGWGTSL